MPKKSKKQAEVEDQGGTVAVLDEEMPIVGDEEGELVATDGQPEPETPPEADDYADDGTEDEPEPRPRRGRKPRARDIGPLSLADVVNSPEANDAWWQEHRLVIYRKDVSKDMKALMKADSGRTWIDRISGPFGGEDFDESYLRSHYGGGLFQVFLQEKPNGGGKWNVLMEAEYAIAGPPKYTDEEAAAQRRANPAQSGSAGAPVGDRSEMVAVLELLQRQIERAEAPQAQALASFADTIRTGQQASTEMLMQSMRQIIELRSQPNGGGSDKLIEMLMGMLMKQVEARPAEPQKSSLDQLREMLELQKIVQGLQPKREPGPFDDVAKALMLKAAEKVVPEAAVGSGGGGSLVRDLVAPLIPQIPALIAGIGQFLQQQSRARREQLDHEFRLRAALIDRQRAAVSGQPAPPAEQLPSGEPQPPQPSEEEMAQQRAQQEAAAKGAAQMELFIDALTSMYFGGEDPQDAAITLTTGFPQVVAGLRVQLAPFGEWWKNGMVMGQLRNTYPALRPVLNHPEFPAWVSKLWAELSAPPQQDGATESDE